MNKRQARKAALDIAIGVLRQEFDNPSELTIDVITAKGGDPENEKDWQKVKDALENICHRHEINLKGW